MTLLRAYVVYDPALKRYTGEVVDPDHDPQVIYRTVRAKKDAAMWNLKNYLAYTHPFREVRWL